MKKLTLQEFIDRARSVHGNKYGYAFSVYQSAHEKVMIHCPEHGFFEMTPANHIAGKGCPRCDMRLMQGDCLERMKEIPSGSVDMVLTDPPFGTTACKWDSIIPLEPMWEQLKRVIKPNGAIVMTAQTPFDKVLGASNLGMLRYEWIWEKTNPTGHLNAKRSPMKAHENILIFYGCQPTYNPQMTSGHKRKTATKRFDESTIYGRQKFSPIAYDSTERYPRSVLTFASDKQRSNLHPTQKPVALMEYLIKTYTNEGETVLDFTAGSFTTGVACVNLNRKFIGIELDRGYFDIGVNRIKERINCLGLKIEPEISMGG